MPTTLVFHTGWAANPLELTAFLKNLAISGGLALLAVHGAGALSVDAWLARRSDRPGAAGLAEPSAA